MYHTNNFWTPSKHEKSLLYVLWDLKLPVKSLLKSQAYFILGNWVAVTEFILETGQILVLTPESRCFTVKKRFEILHEKNLVSIDREGVGKALESAQSIQTM